MSARQVPEDAGVASPAASPCEEILYDVFYHAPYWNPDGNEDEEQAYEVTEREFWEHKSGRNQLQKKIVRHGRRRCAKCCRWFYFYCGCGDQDDEDDLKKAQPDASHTEANKPKAAADAASPAVSALDELSQLQANWSLSLSPAGDLLAVVKDASVCVRALSSGFSGPGVEWSVTPDHFAKDLDIKQVARSTIDTMDALRKEAVQASDGNEQANSSGSPKTLPHDIDRWHNSRADVALSLYRRPVCWSVCGRLLALGSSQGLVEVYGATGNLVYMFSVGSRPATGTDTTSPRIGTPAATPASSSSRKRDQKTPSVAASTPRRKSKAFPLGSPLGTLNLANLTTRSERCSVADVIFRRAPCNQTSHGECAELIVVNELGHVFRVHIPTAEDDIAFVHPPNAAAAPTPLETPTGQPPSPAALGVPSLPLSGLRQRRGMDSKESPPSSRASPIPSSSGPNSARGSARDRKGKRRRKVPSQYAHLAETMHCFAAVDEGHGTYTSRRNTFVSATFDHSAQILVLASLVRRTPSDGSPLAQKAAVYTYRHCVSVWRVLDTPPFYELLANNFDAQANELHKRGTSMWARFKGFLSFGSSVSTTPRQQERRGSVALSAPDTRVGGRVILAPGGLRLAVLDHAGQVSLWTLQETAADEDEKQPTVEDDGWVLPEAPVLSFQLQRQHRLSASTCVVKATDSTAASGSVRVLEDMKESMDSGRDPHEVLSIPGNQICDVSWWSSSIIALAFLSGHVVLVAPPPQHGPRHHGHTAHRAQQKTILHNQLGAAPEWFHGSPRLSSCLTRWVGSPSGGDTSKASISARGCPKPHNGQGHRFFVLETERRFKRKRKVWSLVDEEEQQDVYDNVFLRRTTRLLSLSQSTPQEFFARKIHSQNYDEALNIALRYGLDTDAVYRMKWLRVEVSQPAFELLDKLKDRWWVLDECARRIPRSEDGVRLLLEYGVRCTSRSNVEAAGDADISAFDHRAKSFISGRGSEDSMLSTPLRRSATASLVTSISTPHLNSVKQSAIRSMDQVCLCLYRLQFLRYLDRLRSFVRIHGSYQQGSVTSASVFLPAVYQSAQDQDRWFGDPRFSVERLASSALEMGTELQGGETNLEVAMTNDFMHFREHELGRIARVFARRGDVGALETLFHYHYDELCHERLAILEELPETMHPDEYVGLLPRARTPLAVPRAHATADVGDNDSDSQGPVKWRVEDWVESQPFLDQLFAYLKQWVADNDRSSTLIPSNASSDTTEPLSDDSGYSASGRKQHLLPEDSVELKLLLPPMLLDTLHWIRAIHDQRSRLRQARSHGLGSVDEDEEVKASDTSYEFSDEQLTKWFKARALQLDSLSGRLTHAVRFCELGIELGVPDLDTLLQSLRQLEALVYKYERKDTALTSVGSGSGADLGLSIIYLTAEEWLEMDLFEQLCAVLRHCTAQSVVDELRTTAADYVGLTHAGSADNDSKSDPSAEDDDTAEPSPTTLTRGWPLLHRWLVSIAADRLDVVVAVLKASRPTLPPSERIIKLPQQLVRTALACVYQCTRMDDATPALMTEVFSCLPASTSDHRLSAREFDELLSKKPYDELSLDLKVDLFDAHLTAAELLNNFGVQKPMNFFLHLLHVRKEVDATEYNKAAAAVAKLLEELTMKGVKEKWTEQRWTELYDPLLELYKTSFRRFVSWGQCCALFFQRLLSAGHFTLARTQLTNLVADAIESCEPLVAKYAEEAKLDMSGQLTPQQLVQLVDMHCSRTERLSISSINKLVLTAAREFFDSATDASQPEMSQARACLMMVPFTVPVNPKSVFALEQSTNSRGAFRKSMAPTFKPPVPERLERELRLVSAVLQLAQLNVSVVPLQVRQTPPVERMKFVASAISQNLPKYTDLDTHHFLVELAAQLGCASQEAHCKVRLLLAESALDQGEEELAYKLCVNLLSQDRYRPAWRVCDRLARQLLAREVDAAAAGGVADADDADLDERKSGDTEERDHRAGQEEPAHGSSSVRPLNLFRKLNVGKLTAQFTQTSSLSSSLSVFVGGVAKLLSAPQLSAEERDQAERLLQRETLLAHNVWSCDVAHLPAALQLWKGHTTTITHSPAPVRAFVPERFSQIAENSGTNSQDLPGFDATEYLSEHPLMALEQPTTGDPMTLPTPRGVHIKSISPQSTGHASTGAPLSDGTRDEEGLGYALEQMMWNVFKEEVEQTDTLRTLFSEDVVEAPLSSTSSSSWSQSTTQRHNFHSDVLLSMAAMSAASPVVESAVADADDSSRLDKEVSSKALLGAAIRHDCSRERTQLMDEVAVRLFRDTVFRDADMAFCHLMTLSTAEKVHDALQDLLGVPSGDPHDSPHSPSRSAGATSGPSSPVAGTAPTLNQGQRAIVVGMGVRYHALLATVMRQHTGAQPHVGVTALLGRGAPPTLIPISTWEDYISSVPADSLTVADVKSADSDTEQTHCLPTCSLEQVVTRAKAYCKLYEDCRQTQRVLALCDHIDPNRFMTSESYRVKSVLELARSSDPRNMDIARALCKQFDIPLWSLYIERVEWLFDNVNTTEALTESVAQYSSELFTRPEETKQRFDSGVFPALLGHDLERLKFLYELMQRCVRSMPERYMAVASPVLTTHIQVLSGFIRSGVEVDYKKLLDARRHVSDSEVLRIVTGANVRLLARFANRLNSLQRYAVEFSYLPGPAPTSPTAAAAAVSDSFGLSSSRIYQLYLRRSLDDCVSKGRSVAVWFKQNVMLSKLTTEDFVSLVLHNGASPWIPAQPADAKEDKLLAFDVPQVLAALTSYGKIIDAGLAKLQLIVAKADADKKPLLGVLEAQESVRALQTILTNCPSLKTNELATELLKSRGTVAGLRQAIHSFLSQEYSTPSRILAPPELDTITAAVSAAAQSIRRQRQEHDDSKELCDDSTPVSRFTAVLEAASSLSRDATLSPADSALHSFCRNTGGSPAQCTRSLHCMLHLYGRDLSAEQCAAVVQAVAGVLSQVVTECEDHEAERLRQVSVVALALRDLALYGYSLESSSAATSSSSSLQSELSSTATMSLLRCLWITSRVRLLGTAQAAARECAALRGDSGGAVDVDSAARQQWAAKQIDSLEALHGNDLRPSAEALLNILRAWYTEHWLWRPHGTEEKQDSAAEHPPYLKDTASALLRVLLAALATDHNNAHVLMLLEQLLVYPGQLLEDAELSAMTQQLLAFDQEDVRVECLVGTLKCILLGGTASGDQVKHLMHLLELQGPGQIALTLRDDPTLVLLLARSSLVLELCGVWWWPVLSQRLAQQDETVLAPTVLQTSHRCALDFQPSALLKRVSGGVVPPAAVQQLFALLPALEDVGACEWAVLDMGKSLRSTYEGSITHLVCLLTAHRLYDKAADLVLAWHPVASDLTAPASALRMLKTFLRSRSLALAGAAKNSKGLPTLPGLHVGNPALIEMAWQHMRQSVHAAVSVIRRDKV